VKPRQSGRSRSSNTFRKGQDVVEEALAARAGKPNPRYPTLYLRQHDLMSMLRYVKLVDGKGRSITRTLERSLGALGYLTEKQRGQARRVARALQSWCPSRGLPPFVEAMHRGNARAFLADLRKDGLARRTAENYRTVLSRLWEHIRSIEAEFIRTAKHPEGFASSTPLENPWKGLAVPKPESQRLPRKSGFEREPTVNKKGLTKGPAAAANKANERAYRLRATLTVLSQEGVVSNCGIARALNAMGERTPRDRLWDATGVRRLKTRFRPVRK
jgi:hypothetical protein